MKIVIVGAGRGLGHVLAQMLAEKGHTVVAGLRRLDDTISERENLIYLQMDATDKGCSTMDKASCGGNRCGCIRSRYFTSI